MHLAMNEADCSGNPMAVPQPLKPPGLFSPLILAKS